MNANHSFRTSITVLTVATIVGCVVMLFSGFSQFRIRPASNDKALVSTADQKLRNRFGEFYPIEQRVPANGSNSSSANIIQNASQSNTFDEVVTTTSEYDNSEVITSWSSGSSPGSPQVSVPVTINVNNGELMAQLLETRESLAEVKAQQSAIRQDQRVFSYQVHKDGSASAISADTASANGESSAVMSTGSDSESSDQTWASSSKAKARVVSQHKDQATENPKESSAAKRQHSSEVRTASKQTEGHSTSRMRSNSAANSVQQPTQESTTTLSSGSGTSKSDAPRNAEAPPALDSIATTAEGHNLEFETATEVSTKTEDSAVSIEEEVSFEPIDDAESPPSDDGEESSVPIIEPISYSVEETVEESNQASVREETVVQFAPLDEATATEAPASLPVLSFEEQQSEKSGELAVRRTEQGSVADKTNPSGVGTSEGTTREPGLPELFADEENAVTKQSSVTAVESAELKASGKSGRTREQLSSAFAAVRDLPPEDLFGDLSTPFVTPIEPAEPVNNDATAGLQLADSASAGEAFANEKMAETAPPTISFGESSNDGLVVHPSSAASPVELEFGEPSPPNPSLAHSENPGSPEAPVMPSAEQKSERWHKYRSRIYLKENPSPSTPVPPVPEMASTEVPEDPEVPLTPVPAPPAMETAPESSLAESGDANIDSDRTVTDSPLMIPDEDGTTEIARNFDSEKLGSSTLPPVPKLAAVPQLAPVPDLQFPTESARGYGSPVYEPQPVMDRLREVTTEMNTPPVMSSPPMMAQRRMPQKSAKKLPFETTFRRINKRVAWMADAMSSPEKKSAQQKSIKPKPPTAEPRHHNPHPPTQSHGPAVARKNSPSTPMQLPKLNVPRFTVQNFALPNVNFRAIQAPSFQMPVLDTPDWLACPPDLMAPVRNSTAVHRVISTMQFAGQPKALN